MWFVYFFSSNLFTLDWVFADFICLYLIRRKKMYFFWNKRYEFTFFSVSKYSTEKGNARVLRNRNVKSYPSCGKRRQQKHGGKQIKIKHWDSFFLLIHIYFEFNEKCLLSSEIPIWQTMPKWMKCAYLFVVCVCVRCVRALDWTVWNFFLRFLFTYRLFVIADSQKQYKRSLALSFIFTWN